MGVLASSPKQQYGFTMKCVAVCLLLVAMATADILLHVEDHQQDRVFCSLTTQTACSSACSGQACTETCIASCGIFSRPYSYLCSAVAATTCSAATTVAATAAPAADAPFTV